MHQPGHCHEAAEASFYPLDRIYILTAGQPYLIQLIGFQRVRHYNAQVFASNRML